MKSTEPANHDCAVKEQLRLVVHRRDRRNRIHLASFVVCLLAGLVWMCFIDMRKPGNTILLVFIAAPLMGLLVERVWRIPRARCPKCGFGWELADSPMSRDWDRKECPGCGLKVDDGV